MKTNSAGNLGATRRWLNQKASVLFLWCLFVFPLPGTGSILATPIYLDSGTSGSFIFGQSYNETRAVDVTVLSPVDLLVDSMTLSGIVGSGPADAVIYNSANGSLIASATGNVVNGTVTVPISVTLIPGDEYRIGFYGILRQGNFFLPASFWLYRVVRLIADQRRV